jgi:hypothetical protein
MLPADVMRMRRPEWFFLAFGLLAFPGCDCSGTMEPDGGPGRDAGPRHDAGPNRDAGGGGDGTGTCDGCTQFQYCDDGVP